MIPTLRLGQLGARVGGAAGPAVTTWNPSDKGSAVTLSGSNLIAANNFGSGGYANGSVRATAGKSSGKHYYEVLVGTIGAANHTMIGVCTSAALMTGGFHVHARGYGYYMQSGQKWNNNAGAAYGATFTTGDVIGIALDASAGTLIFYKNNVSQGTAFSTIPADTYFASVALFGHTTNPSITGRFKTADFSYTPPTGYAAWGI